MIDTDVIVLEDEILENSQEVIDGDVMWIGEEIVEESIDDVIVLENDVLENMAVKQDYPDDFVEDGYENGDVQWMDVQPKLEYKYDVEEMRQNDPDNAYLFGNHSGNDVNNFPGDFNQQDFNGDFPEPNPNPMFHIGKVEEQMIEEADDEGTNN